MSNQSSLKGTSPQFISELLEEDVTPLSVMLIVKCVESISAAMLVRSMEVFEWKLPSGNAVLCERVGTRVSIAFFPTSRHRQAYLKFREDRPYAGELLSYITITDVPRSYMRARWRRMLDREGLSRSIDIQRFSAHGRPEQVKERDARELVRNVMETLSSLERIRVREITEFPCSSADAA